MDYGRLISRAWKLTWRHRFLWVIGLFATGAGGSCSFSPGGSFQWNLSSDDTARVYSSEPARALQDIDPWLAENLGFIILGILALAVALVVVYFVVSMIAQGAMARATSDLALDRVVSAGDAWGAGRRTFWRYLAMWLLVLGIGIVTAAAVAALVAIAILIGTALYGAARTALIVLGGLTGAILILAAIPVLAAASVVLAYAQRAIWIESAGPWTALKSGLTLLRRNAGTSALVWLISLGLGIAGGIAVVVATGIVAIPLVAVAFAIYAVGGTSTALAAYIVAAVVVILLAAWGLAGIVNAYFWNFWTLTYLHVTDRLTGRLEPPAPEGTSAG